jgi:Txe/YoeB family toxin of Txe-Axe toxin-antitoxin module
MKLPSTVRFADEKVQEAFYKLEKGDQSQMNLFKSINIALDRIEMDAFCGVQIPKKLIPDEYLKRYDVRNLWKYNLPRGWRLMYSIVNNEILVVSLILEWMDHKDYELRLKY